MGEHGEQTTNTGVSDPFVAGQSIDPTVVEQADERDAAQVRMDERSDESGDSTDGNTDDSSATDVE